LPKIFTEAVMGRCELIEVESSWRDKNELLGYYNEFSRTYTPKKFTQALYKAKLDPERLTFIVLDEMNLSRIEYYFSDFLSLMEHEEDRRAIKLLNVGLFRNSGGRRLTYRGLVDGHTLQIPTNVWFVGTANRDESTFEISDKVYDRAHTMNFNKRAPRTIYHHEPIPPRYLSADELIRLLNEAKQNVRYDLETSALVKEVEDLLSPYNITFGNRVANQMEDFISIYCACFPPSETVVMEALETILLSKVVSKLELKSVDNKEYLATEFSRLGLGRCSEFVRRLHED
jgi:5-methylcytosine-specific restriction endonuclease McrBC GTP-binding regulatory subunit McrB